jgi:hypothetical protein
MKIILDCSNAFYFETENGDLYSVHNDFNRVEISRIKEVNGIRHKKLETKISHYDGMDNIELGTVTEVVFKG